MKKLLLFSLAVLAFSALFSVTAWGKDKISPIAGIIIVCESESPRQDEANSIFYSFFARSNLKILTRKHIDQIINEQKFQAGGLTDREQMIRLGRLVGASHVLVFKSRTQPGLDNGPPDYFYTTTLISVQTSEIEDVSVGTCVSSTKFLMEMCSLSYFISRLESKHIYEER